MSPRCRCGHETSRCLWPGAGPQQVLRGAGHTQLLHLHPGSPCGETSSSAFCPCTPCYITWIVAWIVLKLFTVVIWRQIPTNVWLTTGKCYVGKYLCYGIQTWPDDRLMHGICAHARRWPWLWSKVTVGQQRQKLSVELSRQLNVQWALNLLQRYSTISSTSVWNRQLSAVLNYGHMSLSCKTYVRNLVSQFLLSELAFGFQTKEVILLLRLWVI